ncbi:MAG TPA: PEGA domain-containing protein [Patescibacteria group bacterium]|nr:PEGA domain-containing protein [Patescibacteria group bacterium]
MKTLRTILIVTAVIFLLTVTVLFFIGFFKPKPGGILVDTTPASSVYVNGSLVGKTPFKGTYDIGQITLKVVPITDQGNLIPFETKINLMPGIQTVVRREFGKTEEESSGDIISFEKSGTEASLVVISSPDNAQVSIDGIPRGFAPYKNSAISAADHQIAIKSPGYTDRIMTVHTLVGFRLTVFAKLRKDNSAQVSPLPTPTSDLKIFVEILNTPTGFLRVRTEPGSLGEEIAEVKPGSKYLYLDTDTTSGWFKIQYQEAKPGLPNGIVGWVSGEFAKKLEDQNLIATPSPTPN